MRILTFTSLFPNAASRMLGVFVYNRMRSVNMREDCSVEVVAPVPYSSRFLPLASWRAMAGIPAREQIGGLTVHHPRYPLLPKVSLPIQGLSMFLASWPLVQHLHRERRYDCIDAHYVYPDGFAAVLAARRLHLPVVVSARGTDINLYPNFHLIRPFIRFTLGRADGLIGVSSALAKSMVRLGANADQIAVIGNGVDTECFFPVPRQEARQHCGIAADAQVAVAVGGLNESKGHALLLQALARVAPKLPKLQLYCVGDGKLRTELKRLVGDLSLTGRVHFAGLVPQPELRYWFSAADVSCLASWREGWPNVLVESLACGTPVVATRVGGVPEVISSSALGIVVDRDVTGFAAGLEQSLVQQWDQKSIAAHGRSRSWQTVAAEVHSFLSWAMQRRGLTTGVQPGCPTAPNL